MLILPMPSGVIHSGGLLFVVQAARRRGRRRWPLRVDDNFLTRKSTCLSGRQVNSFRDIDNSGRRRRRFNSSHLIGDNDDDDDGEDNFVTSDTNKPPV